MLWDKIFTKKRKREITAMIVILFMYLQSIHLTTNAQPVPEQWLLPQQIPLSFVCVCMCVCVCVYIYICLIPGTNIPKNGQSSVERDL